MIKSVSDLYKKAENADNKVLALAGAHDKNALHAVAQAADKNLISPLLVGDKELIKKTAKENNIKIDEFEIFNTNGISQAVKQAVSLVSAGKADILMKGKVGTADILRGVLSDEGGLKTGKILSHFAVFELPNYHKLIALTDVAMNIAPDLKDKTGIINNAVNYLNRIGISRPKVAVVAAVETVNPKMPACTDAAILTQMNRRGQIANCLIDGPLAFDNAMSKESAKYKGIQSEVAGDADLLLLPDIEAGNVLYKSFAFSGAAPAAVILGAKAPVVLTSRSDSQESKLNSIVLSAVS